MSILVLTTSPIVEAQLAAMRRLAPGEAFVTDPDAARPGDVEVVVAFRLPPGIVSRFRRLRFVACAGAGADELLASGDLPQHVPLTRVRDPRQGARMAQYVAMMVLHWHREWKRHETQQRERRWTRRAPEREEAWTVGLMGFGDQGRAAARALRALGYPLRAWTRTPRDEAGVTCFHGTDDLPGFLAGTRVLVCTLPLTRATRGIVDAGVLSALPRGSRVVNVSRGGVVDESALREAIDAGHVAGAALDVFEREPLPTESPLWADGRIVVTPHVAATPDPDTAARQLLDNLARARRGEPLLNVVDRTQGY